MKSTIEDIWNGNIAISENCGVGDPEIEKLVMLIERHKETLNKMMGQRERAAFEKYADCELEYSCLISKCAFRESFCLGGRLIAEVLLGKT